MRTLQTRQHKNEPQTAPQYSLKKIVGMFAFPVGVSLATPGCDEKEVNLIIENIKVRSIL